MTQKNSSKSSKQTESASNTWWAQRVSAVALLPLIIFFAYFMIKVSEYMDVEIISSMFESPFTTIFLSLFLGTGIYHGNIGMKEIVEDYVHCHAMKTSLIISLNFISFISAVACICAILVIHLSNFNFN